MPRHFNAGLYHVGSRGSDTRHLCLTSDDRGEFEARLGATCLRHELGLVSYALLGNHYHAVFRIPDARLSKALQELHGGYSRHHNRVHARRAHLFQAHCFAVEIESDRQLLTVARYVARNPYEAGLVDDPFHWR
jgi:REP element-mobilizing transposase RayT